MKTLTEKQCQDLFSDAHEAGMIAGNLVENTPFLVVDKNFNGKQKVYSVPGMCGFANVVVKPANCKFAQWLFENEGAFNGSYPGVSMFVHEFGQSYEKKRAYASAFSRVVNDAGIRSISSSRLD